MTTTAPVAAACGNCARPIRTRTGAAAPGVQVHGGRGLCRTCIRNAHRDGTLHEHPRRRRPADVLAEDYRELIETRQCRTRAEVADRLRMSVDALDRALYRAGVDVTTVSRTGAKPPAASGRAAW